MFWVEHHKAIEAAESFPVSTDDGTLLSEAAGQFDTRDSGQKESLGIVPVFEKDLPADFQCLLKLAFGKGLLLGRHNRILKRSCGLRITEEKDQNQYYKVCRTHPLKLTSGSGFSSVGLPSVQGPVSGKGGCQGCDRGPRWEREPQVLRLMRTGIPTEKWHRRY